MPSRTVRGIARSLRIYHGPDAPRAAMDRLYRRFVGNGDLVFDIGAHVGDRVAAFRRLGAHVVAVEPQPKLARVLRLLFHRDQHVVIIEAAMSDNSGSTELHINSDNPTVSTLSRAFIEQAADADGWRDQSWDLEVSVAAVTLDELIARHGVPVFVKVDVEGAEAMVLAGLSQPLPALSFEFTTMARAVAFDALARLSELAEYRYAVALGESQQLIGNRAMTSAETEAFIRELPDDANSGDIYAWQPHRIDPFDEGPQRMARRP